MRFLGSLSLFCLLSGGAVAAGAPEAFPTELASVFARAKDAMLSNPVDAQNALDEAPGLAGVIENPQQRAIAEATVHWLRAEAYLRSNLPEKAAPLLILGLRAIEGIHEPLKLRGDLLMTQGAYFTQSGRAAEALKNFQDAHDIFRPLGERRSQAIALQNIALLYVTANDNKSAEKYFQQAATTFDGDPTLSATMHNNRGNVLMGLDRYAEAEHEYLSALRLARTMKSDLLEARIISNLARNQVEAGKAVEAHRYLRRGLALTNGRDALYLRRFLYGTYARLAQLEGDLSKAQHLLNSAFGGLDLARTDGDMRTSHLYAYGIYREAGRSDAALPHLEALRRLDEEAAKVATTTSAALMAARFDYQGQQLKIERLAAEQERQAAAAQRTLFSIVGAAALLLVAALGWGLINIRRRRDEIAAANIVLGDTNVALEKALLAKTEFLATTSHEIRTPLNGILGMTQVMLSDAKLAPQMRDRIGIVHSAGVTMRSLVDDILDVAKIETGNLTVDPAPMDICAMLRDVTRMWAEQAVAKGLEFKLEPGNAPCWILSDSGRLRQIVFNLLSNAIKFTNAGTVTVRVLAEGEGDCRRLKLSITDSGIGVPAEKFEEIFESFRQVDASTTRRFGGTGLGLTICRNLAQALGGDIFIESEEGVGSTFTLNLPLVVAEAPAGADTPSKNNDASLLILDRNPIARAMLKSVFTPHCAHLRFAGDIEEVENAVAALAFTHLLIDEATLKSIDAEPALALKAVRAVAPDSALHLIWSKPEIALEEALTAVAAVHIIAKPISGLALVDAILPKTVEKLGKRPEVRVATCAS